MRRQTGKACWCAPSALAPLQASPTAARFLEPQPRARHCPAPPRPAPPSPLLPAEALTCLLGPPKRLFFIGRSARAAANLRAVARQLSGSCGRKVSAGSRAERALSRRLAMTLKQRKAGRGRAEESPGPPAGPCRSEGSLSLSPLGAPGAGRGRGRGRLVLGLLLLGAAAMGLALLGWLLAHQLRSLQHLGAAVQRLRGRLQELEALEERVEGARQQVAGRPAAGGCYTHACT